MKKNSVSTNILYMSCLTGTAEPGAGNGAVCADGGHCDGGGPETAAQDHTAPQERRGHGGNQVSLEKQQHIF